jgi:hypothetical protein
MAKTARQIENEKRIRSYKDPVFAYRQGKEGIVRFATETDYDNTLKDEGFKPYDPSDDELDAWGTVPARFKRRT